MKESHAHLAEAKSHGLANKLVHVVLQAGKCWDNIRYILHLKLCNVSIHTYISHFIEIQQRDNEALAAYVHHFKLESERCDFNSNAPYIHIFVKGL